jgi:hypothetical protein
MEGRRSVFAPLVLGATLCAAAGLAAGVAAGATSGIAVKGLYGVSPRSLALYLTRTGCGVRVADVKYAGTDNSAGTFTSTHTGTIGFTDGLVLTTGSILSIPGPNQLTGAGTNNSLPGDPDLAPLIPGYPTNDATILEFDFVPEGSTIQFDYVFASEEYNEFVHSNYNDVFGFFLNGKNIAIIPGADPSSTLSVVSIDNINGGKPFGTAASNAALYLCNSSDSCSVMDPGWSATRFNDLEMDGLTVVLTVTATVVPNEYNHIRFAIADAGDFVYDSAVFIRAGSFSSKCGAVASSTVLVSASYGYSAYPNPWRPGSGGSQDAVRVSIRSVPPGGTVRIYTTGGALVAELVDSGSGLVPWDGRNQAGKDVASGIYFAVAEPPGGGKRVTTRLVIVR